MRSIIPAATALAATAFIPAAAQAATPDFVATLSQAIEREMEVPMGLSRSRASGFVSVAFSIDDRGRATDARIVDSSGRPSVDRAALDAIDRLQLPAGSPAGPHLASLHFGRGAGLDNRLRHAGRLGSAAGLGGASAARTTD